MSNSFPSSEYFLRILLSSFTTLDLIYFAVLDSISFEMLDDLSSISTAVSISDIIIYHYFQL